MRKTVATGLVALAGAILLTLPSMAASGAPAAKAAKAAPKPRFPASVDAPWTRAGESDALDSAVAAVGLCRTTQSSSYNGPSFAYAAPSAGEVNAIVGDSLVQSGTSNYGCTAAQNETAIAVNPANPANLVAGANDYRVPNVDGLNDGSGWAYYSFDGGRTWGNVQVPGLAAQTGGQGVFAKYGAVGDPALAWSADGSYVYYANIVFSRSTDVSGVAVSRSADGGMTWSAPVMIAQGGTANFFNDKEWIAAGPNGQVVVTWTRFDQSPQGLVYNQSPIVAAYSDDFGSTWNRAGSPVSDPTRPFSQGSQVSFGPDGSLYVAYETVSPASGYTTDEMALARSTDFGRSWATVSLGRVYDDTDCYPTFDGSQTLSDMHFRINSYPSMDVDPVTGAVAVVWADDQGAGSCGTGAAAFSGTTSNQVKLVKGQWGALSAPSFVTTGRADRVFPTVVARGGKVAVGYYTREYPAKNKACYVTIPDNVPQPIEVWQLSTRSVCLDYAAATSSGSRWSVKRLTSEGSNPFVQFANGAFIGDYTDAAVDSNGRVTFAWTDFRGRPGTNTPNQDVYVSSLVP